MPTGDERESRARPSPSVEGRDNPLERLELLAGDDAAIESFLDELDVQSPRAREMLAELARTRTLARPDRFSADHRRVVAALESLRRHGYRGSRSASQLGPLKVVPRWGVELVARYIVLSYVKTVATELRNLYLMREIESVDGSVEVQLLRPARIDAEALVDITGSRALGVPTFVIGGLLVPLVVSLYRLATGLTFGSWITALVVGALGAFIGIVISWVLLRGTAMASRRIRLSVREPLRALWASVGYCSSPPKDESRRFAVIAISLTVAAWIVLPALVGLSFLD